MRRPIHRPWTCALGVAVLLCAGVSAWHGDTVFSLSVGVILGVCIVLTSFIPKETP